MTLFLVKVLALQGITSQIPQTHQIQLKGHNLMSIKCPYVHLHVGHKFLHSPT